MTTVDDGLADWQRELACPLVHDQIDPCPECPWDPIGLAEERRQVGARLGYDDPENLTSGALAWRRMGPTVVARRELFELLEDHPTGMQYDPKSRRFVPTDCETEDGATICFSGAWSCRFDDTFLPELGRGDHP